MGRVSALPKRSMLTGSWRGKHSAVRLGTPACFGPYSVLLTVFQGAHQKHGAVMLRQWIAGNGESLWITPSWDSLETG